MTHKVIISILIFLVAQTLFAQQEEKEIIKNDFMEFMQSMEEKDFDKTLTYLTDELFEIISKERFKEALEKTFNNPAFKFHYSNSEVQNIQDSKIIDGQKYRLISYSFDMVFELDSNAKENETPLERMNRLMSMKNYMQKDIPEAIITLNTKSGFLTLYTEYLAYAIKTSKDEPWKFITLSEGQENFYSKVLPQELIPE